MLKWINKKRNKKGFTLVELVVVIAILGILVAIAVPRLTGARTNAAIKAHNANIRTLESAATVYLAEEGIPEIEETWDGSDEQNWKDYLQSWPVAATGTGKTVDGEEYEVTIDAEGEIEIAPGYIEAEDESTD